jgi:hypothetical protein
VLGRAADADIQIVNDPNVSRRHVRLIVTPDIVEVEDLGSSNGTWLDGKLIQHPLRMPVGGKLRVGAEEFELRRLRPVRRGRESATTSPDIPMARPLFIEDSSSPDAATRQETPVDMIYDQVVALLDKRRVEDARRFVDPLLGLLELGHRPLQSAALERVSVLALGPPGRAGRPLRRLDHRRASSPRPTDEPRTVACSAGAVAGYPSLRSTRGIDELGLAGTPAETSWSRDPRRRRCRGFTVPARRPEVAEPSGDRSGQLTGRRGFQAARARKSCVRR